MKRGGKVEPKRGERAGKGNIGTKGAKKGTREKVGSGIKEKGRDGGGQGRGRGEDEDGALELETKKK